MATQSVEFTGPPNQTLTVRLFAAGSDTIVATAGTVTAATNRAGLYTAAFTDVPAGRYRLIATNAAGTPLATWWTDLTLTTATFDSYEMPMSLVQTVTVNNDKTGYTLTVTPPTAATIADAVWDEALSGHLTAGTTGKALDTIKKSNTLIEGTVLASPTPTTTVFSVSGVNYPTGAFKHAVLLMADDASIAEQNSPLLTYVNNGDGTSTITIEEPFTTAPSTGDKILIIPTTHVHSVAAIQAGLATLANQTAIKAVTDKLNTGLVADGQLYQFTANMLELAPGGGGGGSATLENQELILDEIDSLRSSFASAVGRLAVSAQLIGFPPSIVRNADYSTVTESEIRLSLKDIDGAAITEIGGVPCDEITWLFGLGSERSPALIEGAATWDDTNDQLVIQLAADDTADKPTGTLTWQIGCTIDETTRYLGGGTTRLLERHF